MIGRVLGERYQVVSRLGEGGMGTVYLCEHAVLKRRFALKVLRPELATDPELVERFRNEAIAASRIGQENVVDVVDFGAEPDGALYYVMEALDGRNLGLILRDEGPLTVPRTLGLLEQICRALGAAHVRGVVHRDVKPENILVVRRHDGSEWAKVLDFGISHVPSAPGRGRLTRAGSIIGTPEYMAPEQATGGAVDHRADVYAVGVLAYEMLTGGLPFEATSDIATLVAAQLKDAEPPSARNAAVPPEVDAVVLRALAKRPEDRFSTMAELGGEIAGLESAIARANGLRAAITARTGPGRPSAPRGGTMSLPQPRSRRVGLRAYALAVAAIACAAVVALAGSWMRRAGAASGAVATAPAEVVTVNAAPTPSPAASPASPDASATVQEVPAPFIRPTDVAPPAVDGARPVRARTRPAAPARADDVKDPYSDGNELKPDPFR